MEPNFGPKVPYGVLLDLEKRIFTFWGHICVIMYHFDQEILKNIFVYNLNLLNPHTCHKYVKNVEVGVKRSTKE